MHQPKIISVSLFGNPCYYFPPFMLFTMRSLLGFVSLLGLVGNDTCTVGEDGLVAPRLGWVVIHLTLVWLVTLQVAHPGRARVSSRRVLCLQLSLLKSTLHSLGR